MQDVSKTARPTRRNVGRSDRRVLFAHLRVSRRHRNLVDPGNALEQVGRRDRFRQLGDKDIRRITPAGTRRQGVSGACGQQARARRGGRRTTREAEGGRVNSIMPLIFKLLGLRLSARF